MTEKVPKGFDRRSFLNLGIGSGLLSMTGATPLLAQTNATAPDSRLLVNTPQEKLNTYVKVMGSTRQDTIYTSFKGILWGIVPDREPTQLCGFHGLGRFDWQPQRDGSFVQQSFDVGMFNDLQTGQALSEMHNPLTGETVVPHHFRYGGGRENHSVNGSRAIEKGASNKRTPLESQWETQGNSVWLNTVRSGVFPHPIPVAQWPRESSGEEYLFGSESTYVAPLDQVTDQALASADYNLFWSSVTSWEAWMLMGDTPGFVLWRGYGQKLQRPEDAPKGMLAHINKVQPNYFEKDLPWQGTTSSFDSFMSTRSPAKARS